MKKLVQKIMLIMTVFMLTFGFGVGQSTISVYAASSNDVYEKYDQMDESTQKKEVYDKLNSMGSTKKAAGTGNVVAVTLTYDGQTTTKYLTNTEVDALYSEAVTQLDAYVTAGGEAKNSTQAAKKQVKNMMNEFEVTADTGQAATALAGIQQLVGVVVGILAYAVVIGMSLFTGCDIVYITMPVFRSWADTKGATGGAVTSTTNKDTGESKFRFVTDEAMYAVSQATVENGKNALGIYFKKRCVGWILTAIVLYVLLTGQITLLTDVILQFISGIIAALQSLGN